MRLMLLTLAGALAIPLGVVIAQPASAAEIQYPYCATANLQEGLDCDFQTFQQCAAAIAGFNRTCVPNPYLAGSQVQVPQVTAKRRQPR